MLKNKKAFAILELLVVVVIISVIAVMAIPKFISTIEKSKESRELAEIDSVQKALNHFYIDNGYYPTLQGGKPTFGDPKNIKFSEDLDGYGLYPKYLSSLPHFSYWWVDYKGTVYHTQYGLGQLEGTVISGLSAKYTYKVNGIEFKGNSVDLSGGKVLSVYDSKGNRLPDITADFKGGIRDPNDPNKNNEDTNNGDEPTPEPAPEKTPIDLTCLKFPGDVTIPRQSYVLSTNYTIETRVKVNSSTGVQGIITKGALANRELYLEISNGTLYYFIYNSARTPEGVSSSKNIYDNKWHHIAITNEWTDKGDLITLYIDGEKFQKQTSIHQSRNTNPITLGDVASGDGRKLNGFMDEVRIWNTVRTQEQINDCKDYELEGTEEGLVSYYNMNEGIGTIVHDKTANQNHASVSGTTWIDRWYLPPSANVGKVYNLAEAGWNRFDDSSPGITYTNMTIGTTTDTNNFFNGTYHQDSIASNPIGTIASSEFKMTGTQFRLMIQCYPSRNAKIRVYVDDEYIGWFSAPQNQINGRACCFESPILSDGTHTIKLENVKDGTGSFILDAIDIKGGVVVNEAPPNLVLGLHLNEDSGTYVNDYGSKGYIGTYYGTSSVVDGVYGKARHFQNVEDRIDFNAKVIPVGAKSIRFKMRSQKPPTNNVQIIMDTAAFGKYEGDAVVLYENGTVQWRNSRPEWDVQGVTSTINVCDGQWHDVLFTWDGTTNTNGMKVYIDNMDVPNAMETGRFADQGSKYNLRIGYTYDYMPKKYQYVGDLDEIEIYSGVIDVTTNK